MWYDSETRTHIIAMTGAHNHMPLCCVMLCPQNTSLKEITNTINVTGVTRVKLSEEDIRKVVNTLIADCRYALSLCP